MSVEFEWDDAKNASNQKKHKISFETALHVFKDPFLLTKQARFERGEYRWLAIGTISGEIVLLVAHTSNFEDSTEIIRIISARNATAQEKREYEQNYSI